MSATGLISSGPLLRAMPVAAAAGAVTFLSPCCLPLVPGYLSYLTGMSGAGTGGATAADAGTPAVAPADGPGGGGPTRARSAPAVPAFPKGRAVAGPARFVLGFSLV